MASAPLGRCPPITLIGERAVVLSIASQWVAAVYAVDYRTSDPPGPRFKGRDATVCLFNIYLLPEIVVLISLEILAKDVDVA